MKYLHMPNPRNRFQYTANHILLLITPEYQYSGEYFQIELLSKIAVNKKQVNIIYINYFCIAQKIFID